MNPKTLLDSARAAEKLEPKRVTWNDPGGRVVHVEQQRDSREVRTACGLRYPASQIISVGSFYERPECRKCFMVKD